MNKTRPSGTPDRVAAQITMPTVLEATGIPEGIRIVGKTPQAPVEYKRPRRRRFKGSRSGPVHDDTIYGRLSDRDLHPDLQFVPSRRQ